MNNLNLKFSKTIPFIVEQNKRGINPTKYGPNLYAKPAKEGRKELKRSK